MQMIEVSKLKPHPCNNDFFDDIVGDKWEDFKKSIVRRGVVEGIVVTQDLLIVSGHQRVRACKELGILEVPCRITHYPDIDPQTRNIKEDMILEDLISTNILQRGVGNVNPMKMARCIVELERIYGIKVGNPQLRNNFAIKSQEELSETIGLDKRQIQNYKKLNTLIPEFQELVETNQLKATTAYKIWARMPQNEQEKFFNDIGKDRISKMTQKETKQLLEEKHLLEQSFNELAEKKSNLDMELQQLKSKLENRPTIEVEKEILPSDYNDLKKKVKDNNTYYNNLKRDYDNKVKKLHELEQQIKSMTELQPEEKYNKKLKNDTLLFCTKIENFISQVGGLAYLSNHLKELPPDEKKAYIKCVELVEGWTFNIKVNMQEYL